jgi:hypothetical protein
VIPRTLDTQYNSVKNATTPNTPSSHDMFRTQTAIFTFLTFTKTVPLSTCSHHMRLRYHSLSRHVSAANGQSGLGEAPVEGSCEHGIEPSDSIKFWEIPE